MPYNEKQCRKFAIMDKNGEKVPDDWKKHCKGKNPKKIKSNKRTLFNSLEE